MSTTSVSDDAPCGSCQALVCGSDQALECDICRLWYHIACSGSSLQCCELITNCEGLTWMCPNCRAALRFAATEVGEIDTENMALRLQLSELHNEVKLLRGSLTSPTDVMEPMAALPTAPKQDSLHTNIPIRGSASCPIFNHRKADAVAEEAPAPPASTKSRNPTPHHISNPQKSKDRPNKPPLQVSELPEIQYIWNIPKEMTITEIQSILKEKKFVIKDCWIEQTISQEEFKGNKKFVRIILPNTAAADKFANNMKSLGRLKWNFSRVAPKPKAQTPSSNPTRKPNTPHEKVRKPNLYTDRTTTRRWTTETGRLPPKTTNGVGNQPAHRPAQVPVAVTDHFLGLCLPPPHPPIQGAWKIPTLQPPVPQLAPPPPPFSMLETWRNPPFHYPIPQPGLSPNPPIIQKPQITPMFQPPVPLPMPYPIPQLGLPPNPPTMQKPQRPPMLQPQIPPPMPYPIPPPTIPPSQFPPVSEHTQLHRVPEMVMPQIQLTSLTQRANPL